MGGKHSQDERVIIEKCVRNPTKLSEIFAQLAGSQSAQSIPKDKFIKIFPSINKPLLPGYNVSLLSFIDLDNSQSIEKDEFEKGMDMLIQSDVDSKLVKLYFMMAPPPEKSRVHEDYRDFLPPTWRIIHRLLGDFCSYLKLQPPVSAEEVVTPAEFLRWINAQPKLRELLARTLVCTSTKLICEHLETSFVNSLNTELAPTLPLPPTTFLTRYHDIVAFWLDVLDATMDYYGYRKASNGGSSTAETVASPTSQESKSGPKFQEDIFYYSRASTGSIGESSIAIKDLMALVPEGHSTTTASTVTLTTAAAKLRKRIEGDLRDEIGRDWKPFRVIQNEIKSGLPSDSASQVRYALMFTYRAIAADTNERLLRTCASATATGTTTTDTDISQFTPAQRARALLSMYGFSTTFTTQLEELFHAQAQTDITALTNELDETKSALMAAKTKQAQYEVKLEQYRQVEDHAIALEAELGATKTWEAAMEHEQYQDELSQAILKLAQNELETRYGTSLSAGTQSQAPVRVETSIASKCCTIA